MKFLRKLYFTLLYLLPAILFFSYYPLIPLGSNATMNFELSLPLIFLVIFDIIAFLSLIALMRGNNLHHSSKRYRIQSCSISDRKFFLFSLFPLYATLSIFWSANPTRAILTAGVLWLTFFAAFSIIYITPLLDPSKSLWKNLIFSLFISTAAVCLFCWAQCILDVLNVPRDFTLLCPGCTYRTFGFPHPSGFAIEPQFMGNLLLAPTLLSVYFLAFGQNKVERKDVTPSKASSRRPSATNGERDGCRSARNDGPEQTCRWKRLCLVSAILFSSTLFLTLSRGAIYAYAIALLILFIFALIRHQKWFYVIIIPIATFLLTLTVQGIFSAVSPTSDTFISGTTKIIHQLSLGIIDLRPRNPETSPGTSPQNPSAEIPDSAPVAPVENPVENSQTEPSSDSDSASPSTSEASTVSEDSQFDGYIPESTNTRLELNSLALDTWLSSPYYIFFGVGLGGAGLAMSAAFPENLYATPDAIVQNEGISLLLELGLFGIALLLLAFALAFIPGRYLKFLRLSPAETSPEAPSFWRLPILPFFLALLVAYLITLGFFSGLPNALHIYLLPPLIYLAWKNYCHSNKPVLK